MRNFGLVLFLTAVGAIFTLAAAQSPAIRRTADGKPDFTGVWAGPAFSHKVGPGDTDDARPVAFDRKNMAAFKPGGEAFMSRKLIGDIAVDDPTELCLPNGLTRQILSPYAQ